MEKGKLVADKVIETSPIRLSADETRLIVRCANANGKPVCDYRANGLVEMGILKREAVPLEDHSAEIANLWKKIRAASGREDVDAACKEIHKLNALMKPPQHKNPGYRLTELGKQIARGITVRLNGQFAPKGCV